MKTKKLKTSRIKFLTVPEIKKNQKISEIFSLHFLESIKEK
tara:strand:+ start:10458 stop:10580 length:123 start_codon:yes stop_codon:yes gene_type:complete